MKGALQVRLFRGLLNGVRKIDGKLLRFFYTIRGFSFVVRWLVYFVTLMICLAIVNITIQGILFGFGSADYFLAREHLLAQGSSLEDYVNMRAGVLLDMGAASALLVTTMSVTTYFVAFFFTLIQKVREKSAEYLPFTLGSRSSSGGKRIQSTRRCGFLIAVVRVAVVLLIAFLAGGLAYVFNIVVTTDPYVFECIPAVWVSTTLSVYVVVTTIALIFLCSRYSFSKHYLSTQSTLDGDA